MKLTARQRKGAANERRRRLKDKYLVWSETNAWMASDPWQLSPLWQAIRKSDIGTDAYLSLWEIALDHYDLSTVDAMLAAMERQVTGLWAKPKRQGKQLYWNSTAYR